MKFILGEPDADGQECARQVHHPHPVAEARDRVHDASNGARSRRRDTQEVRGVPRTEGDMSMFDSSPEGFRNVSLADEGAVKEIVSAAVKNLWEAVNTLTRLRPSRIERYRVAIFGSARAGPGTFAYDEVKRAAAAFTAMGCDIVTGGGPGLMQAANEGAASAGDGHQSVGIRVELPFEQDANPFVEQVFRHKTFFSRLHHFVIASDAFVVAPGGIGTVLETFMIWQLLQVRCVQDVPLILVGPMWKDLVEWARNSMLDARLQLASPRDLDIPRCVETADEAIALVREGHARWRERQEIRPQHHETEVAE
jgi:hypothetical protein